MSGLLDGDQRPGARLAEPVNRLYDDLDILTLLTHRCEERQIAQAGEQTAQFRLEDHQHRHGGEAEEGGQQCREDGQLERGTKQRGPNQPKESHHHRPAACAPEKLERVINGNRQNGDLSNEAPITHDALPNVFQYVHQLHFFVQRLRHTDGLHRFGHVMHPDDIRSLSHRPNRAGERGGQAVFERRPEQIPDERFPGNPDQ